MDAIWSTDTLALDVGQHDYQVYDSARCGSQYKITGSASRILQDVATNGRLLLAEYIRRNRSGEPVWIDSNTLERALQISPPSVSERIERGIEDLVRNCPEIGKQYGIGEGDSRSQLARDSLMGATFSHASDEVLTYLREYEKVGYLSISDNESGNIVRIHLTLLSYQFGDEKRSNSQRVFVAMWFSDSMQGAFDGGIEPAIRDCGYRAIRIDQKEHNNKIDDEIIAEIRQSKFVIADFTSEPKEPRGGVYFEAGYALALGLPVIWTCKSDLIDQVHFDTRQFNHITWTDADDLKTKLINRIRATIGQGPLSV